MEETRSQTQDEWSYGLFKNTLLIAPEGVRTALEVGDKERVLIRVQGMSVGLFVGGEPVELAPYLVYASPNSPGMVEVREYEGAIAGHHFRIYYYDADTDIDLIEPDGTVWYGMCRYQAGWGLTGECPEDIFLERE